MDEGNRIIKEAKDFYLNLSNYVLKSNTIQEIKIIDNEENKNLSERIMHSFLSNFRNIINVYSFEDRLEITTNFSKSADIIYLNQDDKFKEYLILEGKVRIKLEYLSLHKLNLTYEILSGKVLTNQSDKYNAYSINFYSTSKTIKKSQLIDIFKDSDKFIDFLIEEKSIETLALSFRCEYIPREREIWSFEERKEIARLLRKKPQSQYSHYVFEILKSQLEEYAILIIQKNPEAHFLRVEEVKYILYYIVLVASINNKKAIYLFEFMENEEEFKSFLFSILQSQLDKNYFMNQFKKISKIDFIDDIENNEEYKNPFLDGPEKKIIEQTRLEDIYSCLLQASKRIENKDRSNVVSVFLELAFKGEDYSVGEVHRIFFPEMNRNTFYAHRHYGLNIITQECNRLYRGWR